MLIYAKVRSDNLKLQKERRDQYAYSRKDEPVSAAPSATTISPLYNPERRVTRDVKYPANSAEPNSFSSNQTNASSSGSHGGDAVIDFSNSFMQQQLQEPNQNSAYLEARDQTIESIESTIAELGQVYSRYFEVNIAELINLM